MILTKTVEEKDYDLIANQAKDLEATYEFLSTRGAKLDAWNVSHIHRKWEWGMALKAFQDWMIDVSKTDNPEILDVGSGDGLLGPTFAWAQLLSITELEPRIECLHNRSFCNSLLKAKLNVLQNYDQLVSSYDVVFSISVMEHVQEDKEFLLKLASLINPKGLLFITTDVMPIMPGQYHFDNLRAHNYTMFDICTMIKTLNDLGFELFEDTDLEFKGAQVFDYSFASICMIKK
jgi:2-polyprenyl-3-methyl-5-hydroxy-6-metoxy-1,4-benzoquinol methylase